MTSMAAFQIFGLFLSIAILIFMIFKGVNPLIASITAALAAGLTNGLGIWETLTDYYVNGFITYFGQLLIMFILSTIYGQVMGESGSAHKIAYTFIDLLGKKSTILVIGLTTGILVYGGVSAMVVVFTVLPFAIVLIEEANIPKVLLPAIITWGQATFAMGSLPGSPQLANVLPPLYFGTQPTAGAVLGIISAVIIIVLGYAYLQFQVKVYAKKGIGYDPDSTINLQTGAPVSRQDCPGIVKAFLPILILIVLYITLANGTFGVVFSSTDAVNTAIFAAIVSVFLLHPGKFKKLKEAAVKGSMAWPVPLINFASIVAFGSVIQAIPGFSAITGLTAAISGNSYVSAAVSVNLLCGITGSASGGLTIALNTLAETWLSTGANPSVLHRICAIASTGFDSMPHCGGVTTVSSLCNEPMKDCYKHIFVSTTLVPVIALIITLLLAAAGVC